MGNFYFCYYSMCNSADTQIVTSKVAIYCGSHYIWRTPERDIVLDREHKWLNEANWAGQTVVDPIKSYAFSDKHLKCKSPLPIAGEAMTSCKEQITCCFIQT